MAPIALTLYTRPECHLCTDMKAVVLLLAHDFGCTLEQVDITGDAGLEARFGMEVPVLCINGRKAFKYRVNETDLRRQLRREERK